MRIAKEGTGGEVAACVRRVRRLGGERLFGRLLVERSFVGIYSLLGAERRQSESDREQDGESRFLRASHMHRCLPGGFNSDHSGRPFEISNCATTKSSQIVVL